MTLVYKVCALLTGQVHHSHHGGLAQLARAPALQAGGHRFESDILHYSLVCTQAFGKRSLKY